MAGSLRRPTNPAELGRTWADVVVRIPRLPLQLTFSRRALAVAASVALLGAPRGARAQLQLSRLVGDGMVMQRNAPVPVTGRAAPGAAVTVRFAGRAYAATADARGAWAVTLPPRPAGGPFELRASAGGQEIVARDVLVGDVWVASGQSNMEWPLSAARDAEREVAAATDAGIRHFKVPVSWATRPADTVAGGRWQVASPATAGDFSAVAYFFARDLRRHAGVPIGILNTTWGGSRVEPWTSAAALGLDTAAVDRAVAAERTVQQRSAERLAARLGGLPTRDAGLVDGRAVWADPALADSAWAEIPVPGAWEQAGYENLDGVAWYRTVFDLTEAEARAGARLGLGAVDDADRTWVNGQLVGQASGYNRVRVYDVPAGALRAGRNVVAVRVEDTGGGGGVQGNARDLFVDVGGVRRPLAGRWRFRVAEARVAEDGQRINKLPAVIHNAMVHPLLGTPVAGVIWYQGESNADRLSDAAAYRARFADLVTSWRREWARAGGNARGQLPFLWVQLANYMAADSQPARESAWATLREGQHAALALPRTAEVVAVDVGEGGDIHPRDKQDVGARLALAARRVAYGQAVEHSGPVYRAHRVTGDRVEVTFAHAAGLCAAVRPDSATAGARPAARDPHGAVALGGFAVAGADRRFVWADAAVVNGRVVVRSPAVPRPVAVRYAWGNNPDQANLYNAAGLPAAPFRTDAW